MARRRRTDRLRFVRNGRRYSACGLRGYRACGSHAKAARPLTRRHGFAEGRASLLPGATLALIVLFSVFVLGRPPTAPDDPQRRTPIVGVAHYTFADFASASR